MEPAKIDWKTIESEYVVDDLYEHIQAPKWVDFSSSASASAASANVDYDDDVAWFCRPDCNHPKTVEDFLRSRRRAPSSSPPLLKLQRSMTLENHCLGDRSNRRDANLKRRPGFARPLLTSSNKGSRSDKIVIDDDGENQDPNLLATPSRQYNNSMKSALKSSTDKKKKKTNCKEQEGPKQQLRSTLSARNLFAGRDNILNQISEFCGELKRLAIRAKEREPLLEKEIGQEKSVDTEKKSDDAKKEETNKIKQKKRIEKTENTPPPISSVVALNKKKNKDAAAKVPTCPPSPQCFSAATNNRTPLLKPAAAASRNRLQERGVLKEMLQKSMELSKEEEEALDHNNSNNSSIEREATTPTLDVFWFLKPCSRLSS